MAFASLQDFFAMGGHAPYVWSAWAVTALLLLGSVVHARAERRQLIRDLQRRERRERRVGSEPARNLADDT
ncbi:MULTISPECIES: heme exporter protein CcmD [Halomonadaceae]|uniref:Heme exporter protein D n=2 Tax=Halomonadaceae TaxID=28256 RepID=A0A2A2ERG1_9GAMM|nr:MULTISPECIES: heme exporter protein CcmD [Halomonas]MDR5906411.1 heme exporter protein CcmD [Halomonas qiaohouensis]PAU76021.1 heme exporter protein CcmD [Halomonas salipaludis]